MKKKTIFPKTEKIFSWVEGLCSFEHRRTGSAESQAALKYLRDEFEKIGFNDINTQRVQSANFEVENVSLKVNGEDIPCFMINGTLHPKKYGEFEEPAICRDTEIIYLAEGREEDFKGRDVKGKIVLCECPWYEMDEETYATTWCKRDSFVYDPQKDNRRKLRKTDSYSPYAWPYNYIRAQKFGAAGFIGILKDYFADGINWNEDYSEIAEAEGCSSFNIPGVWIGTDSFRQINKYLKGSIARAALTMKTKYIDGFAENIYARLPGCSDNTVIVHSHYDAVFNGAVQDASGMSVVLALAEYYSQIPVEQRFCNMIFAGLDGHYTDYAGHKAFVHKMKTEENVLCDFVIEHIGKEVGIGEDNEPIISEEPEIRLMYVSEETGIADVVKAEVINNDIRRTVVMPVKRYVPSRSGLYEFEQDEVISDGYYSHIAGIPIVSILSPQMYLFHPMDRPDMIPVSELRPIGMLFSNLIDLYCSKK